MCRSQRFAALSQTSFFVVHIAQCTVGHRRCIPEDKTAGPLQAPRYCKEPAVLPGGRWQHTASCWVALRGFEALFEDLRRGVGGEGEKY